MRFQFSFFIFQADIPQISSCMNFVWIYLPIWYSAQPYIFCVQIQVFPVNVFDEVEASGKLYKLKLMLSVIYSRNRYRLCVFLEPTTRGHSLSLHIDIWSQKSVKLLFSCGCSLRISDFLGHEQKKRSSDYLTTHLLIALRKLLVLCMKVSTGLGERLLK